MSAFRWLSTIDTMAHIPISSFRPGCELCLISAAVGAPRQLCNITVPPTFLIQLYYHIPQIHLNIMLAMMYHSIDHVNGDERGPVWNQLGQIERCHVEAGRIGHSRI